MIGNDQYRKIERSIFAPRNIIEISQLKRDVTRRSCACTIEIVDTGVDTGEANVLIRFKILIAIEIVVVAS